MPILKNLSLNLTLDEVVSYHGLRCNGLIRPKSIEVIRSLINDITKFDYFSPLVTYEILPVQKISDGLIYLKNSQSHSAQIEAPIAAHHISKSSHLFVGVCTLGSQISEIISELFRNHNKFKSILLEEITNYSLFKISEIIEKQADYEAAKMNLTASGPLNPGDDGFELSSQSTILEVAKASSIDISISPSLMMSPQHSISSIYGIGHRMKKWSQSKNCDACRSRERCRHRIALLNMEEANNCE